MGRPRREHHRERGDGRADDKERENGDYGRRRPSRRATDSSSGSSSSRRGWLHHFDEFERRRVRCSILLLKKN